MAPVPAGLEWGIGAERVQKARKTLAKLKATGLVPVEYLPGRRRAQDFLCVRIEGQDFFGCIDMGPYFATTEDGCWFGVSSINKIAGRWAVCKYNSQPHAWLDGLSDAGVRTVAFEFGLPFAFGGDHESSVFFASKAYDALVAWAKAHPRLVKADDGNVYLGAWNEMAMIDAGLMEAPPKAESEVDDLWTGIDITSAPEGPDTNDPEADDEDDSEDGSTLKLPGWF